MVRMMAGGIMDRFLSFAKAEMIQKNETEIRCPCRRCKLSSLMDPDSSTIKGHLLMRGFMDGCRWEGDEDDYEVVHGGRETVRINEGGQRGNNAESGREEEESPGNDDDAGHNHDVEDAGEDGDGPSSMDWVQDPHLHQLLLNQARNNARVSAREKVNLNQLE